MVLTAHVLTLLSVTRQVIGPHRLGMAGGFLRTLLMISVMQAAEMICNELLTLSHCLGSADPRPELLSMPGVLSLSIDRMSA